MADRTTLGKKIKNWWDSGTPEDFQNSKALKITQDVGLPILAVVEAIASKGQSPGTAALNMQKTLYGARESADEKARQFKKDQEEASANALQRKIQEKSLAEKARQFKKDQEEASANALQRKIQEKSLAEVERKSKSDQEKELRQQKYREKLGLPGADRSAAAEEYLSQEDPSEYAKYLQKQKELTLKEKELNRKPPEGYQKPQQLSNAVVTELNSRRQMAKVIDDLAAEFQKNSDVLKFNPQDMVTGNTWIGNARVKELNRKLQSTNQKIAKLLEEGRMTDADREFYFKTLPKLGESEQSILEKLNGMREYASSNYNSYLSDLKSGNFAVDKFEPQDFSRIESLVTKSKKESTSKPAQTIPTPQAIFDSEEAARRAGKKTGDRVRIKGVGLVELD